MPRKGTPGTVFGTQLSSCIELMFKEGYVVTAIKVKYPGIDPLLIIQARTTEGPQIAFVGGADLDQVGEALGKLWRAGGLKWRPDEWELNRLAQSEET